MRKLVLAGLLALQATGPASGKPIATDEVAEAGRIAGSDLRQPLFLCQPDSFGVVRHIVETQSGNWLPPSRVFDNLYFIGNGFVGVLVLRTSAGLILFDSTASEADARDHLVPGLEALGLRPADIRTVIVTHGHFDHFGGAAWLQRTYGARIALSQADWDLIERSPPGSPGIAGTPRPRRDVVLTDGQRVRLGDTVLRVFVTPGHTPGTLSALIPVRDHGRRHTLSLLGSTAFPPNLEPSDLNGGLLAYDRSVLRFARISAAGSAEGIINTHGFADGTLDRLAAARAQAGGAVNPFLTGGAFVSRYYQVLHHCLRAAVARASAPS